MRAVERALVAVIFGITAGTAVAAVPQGADEASKKSDKQEAVVDVPRTAEEHLARAASYREKAAQLRREAEAHRKMFVEYDKKQGSPALKSKMGREEPWIAKMRQHCDSYINEAEKMASEAERFAEFHRMRGEEMRGK